MADKFVKRLVRNIVRNILDNDIREKIEKIEECDDMFDAIMDNDGDNELGVPPLDMNTRDQAWQTLLGSMRHACNIMELDLFCPPEQSIAKIMAGRGIRDSYQETLFFLKVAIERGYVFYEIVRHDARYKACYVMYNGALAMENIIRSAGSKRMKTC